MEWALLAGAMMLGLAGVPHCAAMCAAPCAALTAGLQARPRQLAFHMARLLSYAVAGAIVAGSVGGLEALARWSPALRPLWTLIHAAALALGLYLLWQGAQPQWMERLGRGGGRLAGAASGWQRLQGPGRSAVAGSLWAAWPCGLLHSALVMAALASSPLVGAVLMLGFGVVTAAGLLLGPALWRWAGSGAQGTAAWAARLAGLSLVLASGWALTHGLWARFVAWCLA